MPDKSECGFWSNKTVLLTGATGFLGGWLIRELLLSNARVVALVRRERPESQFALLEYKYAQRVIVCQGDVSNRSLIERLIDEYQVDVIFHTAMAGGDISATLKDPLGCFKSTALSTWWMLEALRVHYPETILIVSSSDKAYGSQEVPYVEESPLMPRHPQEVAKASQDMAAQSYGNVYGVKVAVTRCANYYGPYDFNLSRLVPYVAKCVAEGVPPVLRSDGEFIRDFLYIQEAAWAHLGLAERVSREPALRGECFNYSYGKGWTVIDVVSYILTISGVDLEPVIVNAARHEIPNMWLSSDKAREMLGWQPSISFEESLEHTVRWYIDYFQQGVVDKTAPHLSRNSELQDAADL